MDILLSAYDCAPGRGSEAGGGWNWAVHLAEAGHRVRVLTHDQNRAAIDEGSGAVTGDLDFVFVPPPAVIRPLNHGLAGVYLEYAAWQWVAYQTALRHGGRTADLVHHVTWGSLVWGSWLWKLGPPFVFGPMGGGQISPATFRSYFPEGRHREAVRTTIVKDLLPLIPTARLTLRRAAVVLAVNSDTLTMARRMGAQDVRLFSDLGLPAEYVPPEPVERPRTAGPLRLLWVSTLYPRKGLTLAFDAVAEASTTVDLQLTVAGDGPLRSSLPEWLSERGIADRTTLLGHVPWNEIPELYRDHDVLLFTSLRDTSGMQMLEGMAHAMPLIVLDHHGAHDLVPEGAGVKVPVTQPTETIRGIAAAIEGLAANPERRNTMGLAGWEHARTQTWDQCIQRYLTEVATDVCAR